MPSEFAKLSKRSVDAAAPKTVRYLIWDSELKGFGLRVSQSGTKTYFVRYRPRGRGRNAPKRYLVIGRHGPLTPDMARARAKALLGSVAAGQDPAGDDHPTTRCSTVAELAELFLREHVRSKRKIGTAAGYAHALEKHVLPRFGKRMADRFTTVEMSHLHLALQDRPYQANRILAVVSSMYRFASKRGLVPNGFNPSTGIERFSESSRERFLTAEELKRLGDTLRLAETEGIPWNSCTDSKHLPIPEKRRTIISSEAILAVRLLLLTGARLREILHLKWSHVDLDRGLLLLPDSKTGRKTIVLSTAAIAILRGVHRKGMFVITSASNDKPRSDLKKPWSTIQRHASLEGVRLHDLRHTFASIGAGASLGLPIVGKLLGHSQTSTTERYAHLDADPLRRASDLIGMHLAKSLDAYFEIAPVG